MSWPLPPPLRRPCALQFGLGRRHNSASRARRSSTSKHALSRTIKVARHSVSTPVSNAARVCGISCTNAFAKPRCRSPPGGRIESRECNLTGNPAPTPRGRYTRGSIGGPARRVQRGRGSGLTPPLQRRLIVPTTRSARSAPIPRWQGRRSLRIRTCHSNRHIGSTDSNLRPRGPASVRWEPGPAISADPLPAADVWCQSGCAAEADEVRKPYGGGSRRACNRCTRRCASQRRCSRHRTWSCSAGWPISKWRSSTPSCSHRTWMRSILVMCGR